MNAYLDNSATTPPCKEAIAAVNDAMTAHWGNPSSLHRVGIMAEDVLKKARTQVADKLFCRPEEIYFTSGGTEGNNLALFGAANAMRHRGKRIVTSSIEHSSIDEAMTQLEKQGFEVIRLPVDNYGRVSEKDIASAVNGETILVSIMAVNNEVGTLQPVGSIKRIVTAARSPALIHCDGVQAFGKMNIRPASFGLDLMTVSAHKIHGIKGAGALYIRQGVRITPSLYGGSQEGKIRPGTQAVPAIAAFGAAAEALQSSEKTTQRVKSLRDYFVYALSEIDGVDINSPSDALPYIVNISVMGINSEPMLNYLSNMGVYVSNGSACSKGKKSRVLKAIGLDDRHISSALRISFSRFTTTDETDLLIEGIKGIKQTIRPNRK
ncbi:MAG: cysteine desulfurase [Clostridiales bacterium]|nr:cysteine desulfurase [Clostridiales bacterium]